MAKGAPDYTKITLLKGAAPDGSLVTLAVDASGNILAVLKGEYAGVLKTVQTDVNGMLLAKIYDPDDIFGVSGTIGLGELAARLGSLMKYDRRGQIAWDDGFEAAVLKWEAYGGEGSATLVTTVAHNGAQSVALTAPAGSYYRLRKSEGFFGTSRIGFQCSFQVPANFLDGNIDFTIRRFDGTQARIVEIRYNPIAGTLKYWAGGSVWTTFATVPAFIDTPVWYTLKFVVDLSLPKYVRCMFQDTEYDLSAIWTYVAGNTSAKRTEFWITVFGATAQANTVYFDDAIITMQEP